MLWHGARVARRASDVGIVAGSDSALTPNVTASVEWARVEISQAGSIRWSLCTIHSGTALGVGYHALRSTRDDDGQL